MGFAQSRLLKGAFLGAAIALCGASSFAESPAKVQEGALFTPPSNTPVWTDRVKGRTFLQAVKPKLGPAIKPNAVYNGAPPILGLSIETPASLLCVYGFEAGVAGCDPNQVFSTTSGGSGTIAIVDAYDTSTILSDLTAFSAQFGLPAPSSSNFEVINLGAPPGSANSTGWDLEASLDTQWAHAMAPNAKIILVEAASDAITDLLSAVRVAAKAVSAGGRGQVSLSWGLPEDPAELQADSYFTQPNGVVFYAASGDGWGTIYPCVSPYVVCVGGTSHRRNPQTHAIEAQWAWDVAGGGTSLYEPAPSYQSNLGHNRITPDVAALADPNNGVWIYNTTYERGTKWFQVGGTSAATPITTALDNRQGNFEPSTFAYLSALYAGGGEARTDITAYYCGISYGSIAGKGWDVCSGWGTPRGNHILDVGEPDVRQDSRRFERIGSRARSRD